MSTAFVLSGGASLGAVQVGMLRALAERGIQPDLLVGTSAGAINAAYIAGHCNTPAGVEALASIWRRLRGRTVFPFDLAALLAALRGRSNAIASTRGLRDLIERNLNFDNLEDAPIPLTVVATNLLTGQEVALRSGSARTALLASCAIPGVLPPVWHHGAPLIDGALANNTPLCHAIGTGVDTIYVLPSGYSCALSEPPRTPLATAVHAITLLTHQRLVTDLANYANRAKLVVLPPPCPIDVSPINFGQAEQLIAAAYEHANRALDHPPPVGTDPGARISLHVHRNGTRAVQLR